jgi:hypothetical protein
MRIQLIILSFLLTGFAFASSDKEMAELFMNYDAVMLKHKVELVDDVFTEKFLKQNGGKKEFIEAVKELPKSESKSLSLPKVSWKKGVKDEMYFASLQEISSDKKKAAPKKSGSQFIVVRENGRLKIDGTLSDAN